MLGTNTITNVLCILLFTLSIPSLAAITDVFNVATGKVPGSCDAFSDILDDDFQQALAMGRSGALAIQRALKGKLSFQGKRMLWMMYGILIEEDTAELSRGVRTKLATIGAVYTLIKDTEALTSFNVNFFCDGNIMTWTEKTIDPDTNKQTENPISEVLPGVKGAYWYAAKKAYVQDSAPAGGEGENPCSGNTGGFVNRKNKIIVICYRNLERLGWRPTLADVKANQKLIEPGEELSVYNAIPGAILHELAHLASKEVIDQPAYDKDGNLEVPPDSSYGFMSCALLADHFPAKSLHNADTYHQFGLASFLNKWDWAEGKAQDPATIE